MFLPLGTTTTPQIKTQYLRMVAQKFKIAQKLVGMDKKGIFIMRPSMMKLYTYASYG